MGKYFVHQGYPYSFSEFISDEPDIVIDERPTAYKAGSNVLNTWSGSSPVGMYSKDKIRVGNSSYISISFGQTILNFRPYINYSTVEATGSSYVLLRKVTFTDSGSTEGASFSFPVFSSYNGQDEEMFTPIINSANKISFFLLAFTHLYKYTYYNGLNYVDNYIMGNESGLEDELEPLLPSSARNLEYIGEYYPIFTGSEYWLTLNIFILTALPEISKFWITPTGAYIEKGGTQQFTANIEYAHDTDIRSKNRWSLEDVPDGDEISISSGGLVTLGQNVTASSFRIKCTLDTFNMSAETTAYVAGQAPGPVGPGDPYNPGGNSGPAGGGGGFGNDRENDDITELIPPGSAANSLTDAGIFSHYLVNSAQLKDFSRWLFSDNFLEVLNKELVELWFGNTFDAIISLMSYPFAVAQLPLITSKPSNIYLGHFDTQAGTSGLLTSDSSQIDWGNIDIREYWGNFLDYAPHTKIQLYLPWGAGFVDIDPNECMNGSLNVKTNIELTKGNCVHIVSNSNGAVIGAYNGFCGAQYPITSKDTSGKAIGAVISAVSAAVAIGTTAAGAASGQAGMAALEGSIQAKEMGFRETGFLRMEGLSRLHDQSTYNSISANAAKTAVGSAVAAARTPAVFQRTGAFSPNAGHLAVQVPYIVMTWPDQSVPTQYGNHVGYPSNIFARLGSLNGYTEVGAIHLDYINCTEHEREELLRILQGGVIL